MKNLFGWLTVGFGVVIGHKVGGWLWTEVLEEKMYKLKNHLKSKKTES